MGGLQPDSGLQTCNGLFGLAELVPGERQLVLELGAARLETAGGLARRQTVDWSGQPCEARFWEWKLGPAKAHYL